DVVRIVLSSVHLWRGNSRSLDADSRIEAQRVDGACLCGNDRTGPERSCRPASVPLARGKTEIHIIRKRRGDEACDKIEESTAHRCAARDGNGGNSRSAAPDGSA